MGAVSVGHVLPDTSRLGSWRLPRAQRALKGWSQLRRPAQRLPIPWQAVYAIAGVLAFQGFGAMSAGVVIAFHAYLRPSELFKLISCCIIAPVAQTASDWGLILHNAEFGVPGKTGIMDESVVVDSPMVAALLAALRTNRSPMEPLWPFSQSQLRRQRLLACEYLNLKNKYRCLYQLRHAGASHDLLYKVRSLEAVQRRGRWASTKSLRRYAKETRLIELTASLPKSVLPFGELMRTKLCEVIASKHCGNAQLQLPPQHIFAH